MHTKHVFICIGRDLSSEWKWKKSQDYNAKWAEFYILKLYVSFCVRWTCKCGHSVLPIRQVINFFFHRLKALLVQGGYRPEKYGNIRKFCRSRIIREVQEKSGAFFPYFPRIVIWRRDSKTMQKFDWYRSVSAFFNDSLNSWHLSQLKNLLSI